MPPGDRTVRVRLEANVVGFAAQMTGTAVGAIHKVEAAAVAAGKQVGKIGDAAYSASAKVDSAATKTVGGLDKMLASVQRNHQALNNIGSVATKVGLVAAAGIGVAAKAAIDWESSWAGVEKTVDGTAQQMADLEGQLRGMARTLPATHAEIAAVAEAAGQLGVRRNDIAAFTKVMVDLGESTNLTSDEAATSLAQFMNVMQTAPKNVGRLGAAIVALGNDGASTERDIVAMAQRISGSGRVIGLTETQVLGFAAALSNVGIEAEAGGSAISTIFTKIDQAVSQGGKGLQDFATVSGMTAAQFKQQFETDAAGATLAFIQGIGAINAAGKDVNGTLETLGITEIRQRDAVLRLAASGTNLADSLKVSADGWRENTALVDEAAKRYATTESQVKIAWNNIKDAAITAGTEMLPVIAGIAEHVADLAKWFGDLPGPIRSTVAGITGFVAIVGLAGGAALKLITTIGETRAAMLALGLSSTRASVALAAIGKASIALGLAAIAAEIKNMAEVTKEMDLGGLTGDVLRFGETGKSTGELLKNFGDDFGGVAARFRADGDSLATMLATVGRESTSNLEAFEAWVDGGSEASKRVHEIDQALAQLVEGGNADSAAKAFGRLEVMAREQNVSLATLQKIFPEYGAAVEAAGIDAEIAGKKAEGAAGPTKSLGQALDGTADSAEDAATKLQKYIDALFKMPGLILGVRDAQRGVQAAIDDANKSIEDNGRTLSQNTEEGRANQAALDGIADRANTLSENYLKVGASQKTMTDGALAARQSFVDTAVKMGMTKAAAQALAEQVIKIPDKKATEVTNNAGADQKPAKDAAAYSGVLKGTPGAVNTTVSNNAGQAPKTAAEIYRGMLLGTPRNVETFVANTAPTAQTKMAQYLEVMGLTPPSKSTKVSAPGADGAAGDVGNLLGLLNNLPASKTVTIRTKSITERIVRTQTTAVTGGHATTDADGGYYPQGRFASYANGKLPDQAMIAPGRGRGLVQWAEGETGGEAFIPLAASKRDRSTQILGQVAEQFGMSLVKSFASGGFLPGGRLTDIAAILRQLEAPSNPLAGINFAGTLAAMNKANAAATPYKTAATRADAREQAAKAEVARIQRAITLQQRYIKSLRDGGASDKKIAREQKELIGLQDQLYAAKNRSTKATKASNAADAAYKVKLEAAKKATDAHKESIEKLVEQQKNAVEMAKQVASGLLGGANIGDLFGKSLTGSGLLADLQQQGVDLGKFRGQIDALRKRGLDEDLIEQLVGKGAEEGGAAAQAILDGGQGLVNALNKAQIALEKQANLIGAGVATANYGVKVAGARAHGGLTNPRSAYLVGEHGPEILRMGSRYGWIQPNPATAAAVSSGAGRGREFHQHLTFYGTSADEADRIAQKSQALADWQARNY